MVTKVFQFKITLDDVKPLVWRRIQILDSCTFWKLYEAIQNAVGWTNSHLHVFELLNPQSGKKEYIGFEDEELGHQDGFDMKVKNYISLKNRQMAYEYDFGDGWGHSVVLEEVLDRQPGQKYPLCIDGARACPPEDVGGSPGYARFLKIMAKPTHPEHKDMIRWVGGKFDPEYFDRSKVRFKKLLRYDGPIDSAGYM